MRTLVTLLALSAALQAQAASLEIEITGTQGVEGQVLVALFDRAEGWLSRPLQSRKITPGADGTLRLRFDDLPEGQYAYSLLHDLNGNGRMDFNLIGMPTEAYAFSNNAGPFARPRSTKPAFTLPGDLRHHATRP